MNAIQEMIDTLDALAEIAGGDDGLEPEMECRYHHAREMLCALNGGGE